jgi:acyl carrier protein
MDGIGRKVIEIVSEQMGVERAELSRETHFINDLNADSLDTVELVMEFEDEFELSIPDEEAEACQTIGDAIDYIKLKTPKTESDYPPSGAASGKPVSYSDATVPEEPTAASTLKEDSLRDIARDAWKVYWRSSPGHVLKPSLPILFFGNSERYFESDRRVITLGINPSFHEFPKNDPFQRFPGGAELQEHGETGSLYPRYLRLLDEYFDHDPCDWFKNFDPLLEGLNCSYRNGPNYAIHTDFCSPIATDCAWSAPDMSNDTRISYEGEGIPLWKRLVEHLRPHVILTSLSKKKLEAKEFPFHTIRGWRPIYLVLPSGNAFECQHRVIRVAGDKVHLVWGSQIKGQPFAGLTHDDKRALGKGIASEVFTF